MMPDNHGKAAPQVQCGICSRLKDEEYAFQKYGAEEYNTYLPAVAGDLKVVRDFHPLASRKLQIRQCPGCCTYYLYRSDYEYVVNGTEDEEFLTRLTEEQAADYLNRSA
jgi:hypothetical protein